MPRVQVYLGSHAACVNEKIQIHASPFAFDGGNVQETMIGRPSKYRKWEEAVTHFGPPKKPENGFIYGLSVF